MINKEESLKRFLDKIDTIHSEEWQSLPLGPMPNEYGMITMNYQEFRKFLSNRTRLAYCQGVYRTLVYVD